MLRGDEPIHGYVLERMLGRGGFGEVWLASAPGGTAAALKFIDLTGGLGQKEMRAVQQVKAIRHAHLLPVTAFWMLDREGNVLDDRELAQFVARDPGSQSIAVASRPSTLVIAMLLGDKSLADRLEECKEQGMRGIPQVELLGYMEDAARGIDFLNSPRHTFGEGSAFSIQHCDIKPPNILLVGDSAMICDFGLARVLGDSRMTSALAGSPAYMAPECIEGRKPSRTTDQYSLAIAYVELRTGKLPFDHESYVAVLAAHSQGELDLSRLPESEQTVIRRATSLDPNNRYRTALDMVRDLRKSVDLGTTAPMAVGATASSAASDAASAGAASDSLVSVELITEPRQAIRPSATTGRLEQSTAQTKPAIGVVAAQPRAARRGMRKWFVAASVLLLAGGAIATYFAFSGFGSSGNGDDAGNVAKQRSPNTNSQASAADEPAIPREPPQPPPVVPSDLPPGAARPNGALDHEAFPREAAPPVDLPPFEPANPIPSDLPPAPGGPRLAAGQAPFPVDANPPADLPPESSPAEAHTKIRHSAANLIPSDLPPEPDGPRVAVSEPAPPDLPPGNPPIQPSADDPRSVAALAAAATRLGIDDVLRKDDAGNVRAVRLNSSKITGEDLAHLAGLQHLEELRLVNTPIRDAGVKPLATLASLKILDLYGVKITDAGLASLANLTNLRFLDLRATEVTSKGMAYLAALENLEQLLLGDTAVDDAGLAHLAGMKRLRVLGLENTGATDKGMAHLAALTELESLDLDATQVTAAGLMHLGKLGRLESLDLISTEVDDTGLAHVGELVGLVNLNLSKTKISDAGLERLRALVGLKKLMLDQTAVGNAGLTHLRPLTGLDELGLEGTNVTDAGIEELRGFRELRHLWLKGSQMTPAGVKRLELVLPEGTRVHF